MNALIIAALTASVATYAPAYADVGEYLDGYRLVESYCYTACDENFAVGLVTKPLFTLSGINAYIKELEQDLKSVFGFENVVVTLDTDLIYRIKKAGAEGGEEVEKIIETARKRR